MWSEEGTEQARNLRDKDANRVTLCHAVTAGRIVASPLESHASYVHFQSFPLPFPFLRRRRGPSGHERNGRGYGSDYDRKVRRKNRVT